MGAAGRARMRARPADAHRCRTHADDGGHGTHTAGIVGAVGNNGVGLSGVNWQVSLLVCKFIST